VVVAVLALAFGVGYSLLTSRGTPPREPELRSVAGALDQRPDHEGGTDHRPPLPPDALFARSSPAVMQVVIQDRQGRTTGSGSGFLVSTTGPIATNYHVIEKAHAADVLLADNTILPVVGAAGLDQEADLAIVKVAGRVNAQPLELAGDDLPPVGAKVYAVGNPRGLANTLSDGLVSGHQEIPIYSMTMIQTTAPISPGSSGGPLLGVDGKVVGVTTASRVDGQNLNFAVPASHVARLLRRCEGQGHLTQFPLVREPDADVLAYIERGDAWMGKNEYDKALKDYDAAVRLDPEYALSYHKRGMAWYCKGEFSKAFKDFNEASRLDPKHFPK
jgi:S1-C subfamily serine protease